uniref:Uncharacterized protein n=1 Tax=Arundo donax TaxID=35708 RepID=A0A0A9FZ24_ARUDO
MRLRKVYSVALEIQQDACAPLHFALTVFSNNLNVMETVCYLHLFS